MTAQRLCTHLTLPAGLPSTPPPPAGNRRKEQNMVKQTIGFNWGASGER